MAGVALLAFGEARAAAPNFIIIYTDDMGYADLACYGAPKIRTPRLDRMAKEGARFTSFYAGSSTCSPSRAAMLTGCYPNRVGFRLVLAPQSATGLDPKEATLAEVLRAKGYATAAVGKWNVGDRPPFLPTQQGFDSYFGMPNSNDSEMKYRILMRNDSVVETVVDQTTLTRRYTDEGLAFITRNKAKPFFLYLAPNAPHVPLFPSAAFAGKSPGGKYGDVVEEIDWNVGRLLDSLASLGLDSTTLVVFSSDNGPWLVQGANGGSALPLRGGKSSDYEGGNRVPGIFRWPGHIAAGRTVTEMAAVIDLYPTFANLAGTTVPALPIRDGLDITTALLGGMPSPRREFFYRTNWSPSLTAVRRGDWKYHQASNDADFKAPEELFNLAVDPNETTNLLASNPAKAQELKKALADKVAEIKRNVRPMAIYKPTAMRMRSAAAARIEIGNGRAVDALGRKGKPWNRQTVKIQAHRGAP